MRSYEATPSSIELYEDAWGTGGPGDSRTDLERAKIFLLRFAKMNPDPVFSFELQAIATDQQYRNITALALAVQTRIFGNRHPSFAPTPLLQCVRFMLIKAKVPDFMYSDKTKVVMDFFFDPTIFRNVEPPPVDAVIYNYPTGRLKVAIVGGGPTALASAISLAEKGAGKIQVHVYERRWVVMAGPNGQTRYLLNASDFDGRGYLNMQLTEEEWHKMLAMDGQPVTFGYPGCLRRSDGTIPPGFNDNQVFAPSEHRGGSLWRSISDGLKLFGFKESEVINVVRIPIVVQAVREGIQYLPPSDSASINRPHALVAVAGDAAMTVHFWPGRGLNSGVKSGIALGDEIVHALNAGKFVGLPLTAMQQYNDFIMKLQDREHDKRSIPILNQSGTPETLGWLLSKANTVPDNVAIEWLVGAMSQIAERLEQRGDWAFQPVANVEPQLRIVLRQLDSETLREMAVSFPWPTREMGGAEVLPLRSMKPEEKQRWLQQLWGLLRDEAQKKPSSRGDQGRSSRFEAPRGAALLPPRATSPSPQFLAPDAGNPTPNRSESTLRRSNASRGVSSPGPSERNLAVPNGDQNILRPRSPSAGGEVPLGRLLSVNQRPGRAILADAMSLALFRVDGDPSM
ncbi:hypothetical protein K4K50_002897 [Colletotrichum sp. SAR 10_71]|nr:hypothetical protein K4K50_002897 [Colletotrichum sp. SAR 10_71]